MSYGYSARLIELNKRADKNQLGVRLGRACIRKKVPVSEIANQLGVSRQTVYNWFCGINEPRDNVAEEIKSMIRSFYGK